MNPLEYRFHSGARGALMVVAVLCFLLIVAAPLSLWILWRRATALVRISDSDFSARGLGSSMSIAWGDVQRIGILKVPVIARGIGGALARQRMGGHEATHLFFKTMKGKDKSFVVSSYESWEQIVAEAQKRSGKSLEALKMGVFSAKWPEMAKAA